MSGEVERFYDEFSREFLKDYVYGNRRIERQLQFFSNAISQETAKVLVIGCGSGEGAYFIATKIAKNAEVLAVDISSECVRLAKVLFSNDRIIYRKADIVTESIEGEWDVIVLPDVYEHIPREARDILHAKLNELLSKQGRILFTVPSPGKQASVYVAGKGLQVIDEVVTLEDLINVAKSVKGVLTYFSMISVWDTNDYVHVIIERGAEKIGQLGKAEKLPIKGWPRQNAWSRGWAFLSYDLQVVRLQQWWRRNRVGKLY